MNRNERRIAEALKRKDFTPRDVAHSFPRAVKHGVAHMARIGRQSVESVLRYEQPNEQDQPPK